MHRPTRERGYMWKGLRMSSFQIFITCSSGVDASVKVVYKPVRRFREEGGLLTKNVTYTYKQVTEILNSRDEPAVITFVDQVPKSQDEKLKVCDYCRTSIVVIRCCAWTGIVRAAEITMHFQL